MAPKQIVSGLKKHGFLERWVKFLLIRAFASSSLELSKEIMISGRKPLFFCRTGALR